MCNYLGLGVNRAGDRRVNTHDTGMLSRAARDGQSRGVRRAPSWGTTVQRGTPEPAEAPPQQEHKCSLCS